MKDIDFVTISQLLGHADIKMTQRYAHLALNHKKIAVNMLNLTETKKTSETKTVVLDFSAN